MSNRVYIAVSLDGFIAKKDGNIDFLQTIPMSDEITLLFNKFLSSVDAVIMGKNTFLQILSFNQWIYTKTVFVLSNSLNKIPKGYENKIELLSGKPSEILKLLNKKGYKNFYIDGGYTIHEFLKENLIDELVISTIPIILGDGISLFPKLKNEIPLKLINSQIISNNFVQTSYKVIK